MRPPTEARRDAREHEHLGRPPLQLPATTSEAHALIRRTNTHRRRRAATKPGRARSRRELLSMANSGAGWYERRRGPPPVRRSGVASSRRFVFPRGGSAQVARALCRALSTIGWGCRSPSPRSGAPASRVMRRASSRGSTSISPRELRREPGAQADSSARDALGGSRRREGRTLEMRPWTSASQPHAHGRAARGSGAARATGRVA
jgi:hypothetical protein